MEIGNSLVHLCRLHTNLSGKGQFVVDVNFSWETIKSNYMHLQHNAFKSLILGSQVKRWLVAEVWKRVDVFCYGGPGVLR